MAQEVKNIIAGAAQVFLSDMNSNTGNPNALPAWATSASATGGGTGAGAGGTAWANVGFTSEGLDLSFEPDYLDVEVDQLLDSAALFKTSQRVTIATSFTEATFKNLAFVLGQPTSTYTSDADAVGEYNTLTISGGALGDAPLVKSFYAVGPSPRTATGNLKTERVYYHPRVISVESVSTGVKRNEVTMFPVTFRCLPDSAATNAEYGSVIDRLYGTP